MALAFLVRDSYATLDSRTVCLPTTAPPPGLPARGRLLVIVVI